MSRPVQNPKACLSRRRRVARILRRTAVKLRKVRLSKNQIKIRRAADLEAMFTVQFLAGLLCAGANALESPAS